MVDQLLVVYEALLLAFKVQIVAPFAVLIAANIYETFNQCHEAFGVLLDFGLLAEYWFNSVFDQVQ